MPDMHETEVDAGMRAAYLSSSGSRLTSAVLPETSHEVKVTVPLLIQKPPPCKAACEKTREVSVLKHVTRLRKRPPREGPLRVAKAQQHMKLKLTSAQVL